MAIMKLGIAFAGGGASGGAHVGVLQALNEEHIPISMIAGTSSGAMVAGLYAAGTSIDALLQLLTKLNRSHMDIDLSLFARLISKRDVRGLLLGDRLEVFIEDILGSKTLQDITFPLAIIATDLQTGQEVVFSSHPCPAPSTRIFGDQTSVPLWRNVCDASLARAIRASISIPLVFQPTIIQDMILADGGLVDNCPVDPLLAMGADITIAVDTITPFLQRKSRLPLRVRTMTQQIINVGLARHALLSAMKADIFLAPPVGPIGALDFAKLSNVAERGYQYTKTRIPQILAILNAH